MFFIKECNVTVLTCLWRPKNSGVAEYHYGSKVKEDEISGACDEHGPDEKFVKC
jgi:hypothetical protein